MRRRHQLRKHDGGAVAPTVALSLFGLIAAGGLAFDYARLAAMDTELQTAADQAALAAATQLDRYEDSQDRATAAVTAVGNANRLAANFTRFANDGDGATVEVSLTFCETFDDDEPDTTVACEVTAEGEDTRYVVVTTETRVANYALTPIVAAFSSGPIRAVAVAGIESSICNVAPLMVCVADDSFPTDEDIGKGIIMKTAGGNSWAPGNYGYLDFGNGNQAVIDALVGHGLNGCQSQDDNETEPGNKNATDAINTRMDIYEGTGATNNPSVCDLADGAGCPAENTGKDMTLAMTFQKRQSSSLPPPTILPNCGDPAGGTVNGVGQTSYASDFVKNAAAKGFGRDTCHYSEDCDDGNFGDAAWDRDGYLAANHPGVTAAAIATATGGTATAGTLTRYQVYLWEIANKATGTLDPNQVGPTTLSQSGGGNITYTFTKQCVFNQPKLASAAYPEQKDRRVLPIVAANCDNLKGKGQAFEDYDILRVFDIFLPEPSLNRTTPDWPGPTDDKEIYGEVIGPATTFAGGAGFQYYSRSKPYLVR